jgi:radical SAM superfamily enzyme YgiQ (UPF0313 family)
VTGRQQSRKIRFIEPGGRPGRPFNAWISHWPLLGPILLATILHRRGHDVAVCNENLSGPVLDDPEAMEDLCTADVVGIGVMTATANRGYQIADEIRRRSPGTTIVFGGVHATFLPEEALAHGDIVVRGEGESVIESIASGQIRKGIVRAAAVEELDSLPAPDVRLVRDFGRLLAPSGLRELYELPLMSSRGCPYGCRYCSVSRMFGRRVRRQSVQKVLGDVHHYLDQGFRRFFFYDDNFTSDRAWSRRLLEQMAPLRVRFNAQVRADFHWIDGERRNLDRPLLQAMRRGGGDVLYIGYETIDDATERQWHKGYRGSGPLERRLRLDTQILHDNGFWIHGMFILGPQHTQKGADGIVNFARRGGIETIQISILTPLPGTPLMQQVRPHLVFTDYPADWDYYDGTHCVYNHARLGIEGLQRAVLNAHRRFYGWTGCSVRRLRAVLEQRMPSLRKLGHLWTNARTARTTLRQWRREMREFLELVKLRTAGLSTHVV